MADTKSASGSAPTTGPNSLDGASRTPSRAADPAPPQPPQSQSMSAKLLRAAKWVLDLMIAQWFLIGIGVVIALAHSYPNVAKVNGVLQAQWSEKYLLVRPSPRLSSPGAGHALKP